MHVQLVHACTFTGCKILLKNQAELCRHLAEDHGVQQTLGGIEPGIPEPSFESIAGWTPQPIPSGVDDLYRWLWPICLQMAKGKDLASALDGAPLDQADRVAYVRQNFTRVADMTGLARYKRLRRVEARAVYLVIALAHTAYSAAYTLQNTNPKDILRAVKNVG